MVLQKRFTTREKGLVQNTEKQNEVENRITRAEVKRHWNQKNPGRAQTVDTCF
jgi:hypothetical protein